MTGAPQPRWREGTIADARPIAALHAARLPEGFLVSLGPRFLTRLYARIARSSTAFALVAEAATDDGAGLGGFVAVAEDTGRLYREFLRHDGVGAALAAAPAVLRAPKRVWETARYGIGGGDDDLPAAEVLAVAVAAGAEGRGLGTALVGAALGELRRRRVPAVRVVTAADNARSLRMYEGLGFVRVGRVEVHADVAQEVLVWR